MKRSLTVLALFAFVLPRLFALPDYLKQSDDLSFVDKNVESMNLLMNVLPTVATDQERAEIYWRLSRDTLHDADDQKARGLSGDALLALYQKGESYADQAIAADPNNAKGYYWKASNIGRWGQARGILVSLFRADPMRKLLVQSVTLDPGYADPWFVLGQLYEQVPGFPISFGNPTWAVSLGRKSLDARRGEVAAGRERDVPMDYFIQMARHLVKRDWSASRRAQEQPGEARKFNSTSDVVEKNFYYEGTLSIPNMSDREEARQLCRSVIVQLESIANRSQSQNDDLKNAKETLAAAGG